MPPIKLTNRIRPLRLPAKAPRTTMSGLVTGVALTVAAAVITNILVAKRTERRHPPQGRFIEIDGLKVHYLEKGTGSPIVLIHGNGVTADDFVVSGLIDYLAADHRVLALDRPGFGYSERPRTKVWTARAQAEHLHAALAHLGVERPVIVGHSWGTLVAFNMAVDNPGYVRSLVLMSGYYFPTLRLDAPLAGAPAIFGYGDLLRFTVAPLLGWLSIPLIFKLMFSPGRVPHGFKARFPTSIMLRPSQIRASAGDAALMVPEAAKLTGRRAGVKLPVLVIAGTGDKIVSFEHQSRRLSADLENGRLQPFPGVGHMVHHSEPGAVGRAIAAFAAEPEQVVETSGHRGGLDQPAPHRAPASHLV